MATMSSRARVKLPELWAPTSLAMQAWLEPEQLLSVVQTVLPLAPQ